MLKAPFLIATPNPGADGRDHGLDLVILEHLVEAGLLDVDELAPNRQNGLIPAVASLLGRTAGGVALDNVELGVGWITLGAVGQLSGQSASGQRALAHRFARLARRLARAGRGQSLVDDTSRDGGSLIEESHQSLVGDRGDDAFDLRRHELHLGLRLKARPWMLDREHGNQTLRARRHRRWAGPFPSRDCSAWRIG